MSKSKDTNESNSKNTEKVHGVRPHVDHMRDDRGRVDL